MEPIIKVNKTETESNGYEHTEAHYFHSLEQAKRWCERDAKKPFEWERAKHINPYCFWSPEIVGDVSYFTYDLEPIEITAMDEDDGEV